MRPMSCKVRARNTQGAALLPRGRDKRSSKLTSAVLTPLPSRIRIKNLARKDASLRLRCSSTLFLPRWKIGGTCARMVAAERIGLPGILLFGELLPSGSQPVALANRCATATAKVTAYSRLGSPEMSVILLFFDTVAFPGARPSATYRPPLSARIKGMPAHNGT